MHDSLTTVTDSLRIENLRLIDFVVPETMTPTGFWGRPLAVSMESQTWVFVVMITLFFIITFIVNRSSSIFSESISMLFHLKERQSIFSKSTTVDHLLRIILFAFFIIILSFYAYTCIQTIQTGFWGQTAISLLAVIAAYYLVKLLIIKLISYVFFDESTTRLVFENYFNIFAVTGICFFPLLVMKIYAPASFTPVIDWATIILLIINLLCQIFKSIQFFLHRIVNLFYILLYLCALEILPVLALLKIYIKIT